jgi:hypothetical protein
MRYLFLFSFALSTLVAPATAAEFGTKDEAVAMEPEISTSDRY